MNLLSTTFIYGLLLSLELSAILLAMGRSNPRLMLQDVSSHYFGERKTDQVGKSVLL